jgi:hypothetical protein
MTNCSISVKVLRECRIPPPDGYTELRPSRPLPVERMSQHRRDGPGAQLRRTIGSGKDRLVPEDDDPLCARRYP